MSISDIINWFITYSTSKMPGKGRGRPQSAWWSHFEMVEGDIFKDVDIYMIFLLLGNFRLVRCLHCNKLVRRGKDGCTSREASNSGMAAHMRSKHAGQAIEVGVFFSRIELNCYSFPILGPEENWRGQEWIQSASWSQGWDCAWQPPPVQAEVKSWQTGLAEIGNVKLSDNGDNNFVFRLFQLRRRSKWVQNTENTKLTPRSWQQSSLTSSLSIKSTGVLTLVCKSWFLEHPISRAGFQMLTSVLDPTFSLSSDGYYRSLLAKVSMVEKSYPSLSLTSDFFIFSLCISRN